MNENENLQYTEDKTIIVEDINDLEKQLHKKEPTIKEEIFSYISSVESYIKTFLKEKKKLIFWIIVTVISLSCFDVLSLGNMMKENGIYSKTELSSRPSTQTGGAEDLSMDKKAAKLAKKEEKRAKKQAKKEEKRAKKEARKQERMSGNTEGQGQGQKGDAAGQNTPFLKRITGTLTKAGMTIAMVFLVIAIIALPFILYAILVFIIFKRVVGKIKKI